jgi:hypothetical protein
MILKAHTLGQAGPSLLSANKLPRKRKIKKYIKLKYF